MSMELRRDSPYCLVVKMDRNDREPVSAKIGADPFPRCWEINVWSDTLLVD